MPAKGLQLYLYMQLAARVVMRVLLYMYNIKL